MPLDSLPTPPPTSGFGLGAALSFFGGIIVALLGLFGVRSSQAAPLQLSVNDAFRTLIGELQEERATLIVRISELEAEVLRQRGVINQGLAREAALGRALAKLGVGDPPVEGIS